MDTEVIKDVFDANRRLDQAGFLQHLAGNTIDFAPRRIVHGTLIFQFLEIVQKYLAPFSPPRSMLQMSLTSLQSGMLVPGRFAECPEWHRKGARAVAGGFGKVCLFYGGEAGWDGMTHSVQGAELLSLWSPVGQQHLVL